MSRHLLGLAVALVVTALLVHQIARDWQRLPDDAFASFHFDPMPLAVAWLVQTAGWLLVVDTWARIVGRLGGGAPYLRHLQIYSYTALAQVLPGSFWVPAGRVAAYRARGIALIAVSAAVVVEWILLGVAGLMLYALAAPFSRALPPAWAPLLSAAGLLALGLLHPVFFRRATALASRLFGRGSELPSLGGRELAGWLLREVVVLSLSGVALYLVMRAISPAASMPDAVAASALTLAVANLLAWLPLTAVVKDAGMVFLLGPLYGSSVLALGVVIAWRIWVMLVALSWAALVTLAMARRAGEAVGSASPAAPDGPGAEEEAWTD